MVNIRLMEEKDILKVQYVAITSWHETYQNIIPLKIQDDFLKNAYNEDMLKKRMKTSYFYIAELDDKIVGFANFSKVKQDGEVELSAIYLLPNNQNKGIGTYLLEKAIVDLQPDKICINVERDNTVGVQFYESKQFKVVNEFEECFDGHLLQTKRMCLDVKNISYAKDEKIM